MIRNIMSIENKKVNECSIVLKYACLFEVDSSLANLSYYKPALCTSNHPLSMKYYFFVQNKLFLVFFVVISEAGSSLAII